MVAVKRHTCTAASLSSSMSGPNSSSEWSIEGRRLVPLMPRLVPQTAFTVTANAVANAALQHNASLPSPAETGSKEGEGMLTSLIIWNGRKIATILNRLYSG